MVETVRLSAERRRDRLDTPARVERIGTEHNATERIACRGVNRFRGLPEQPGAAQRPLLADTARFGVPVEASLPCPTGTSALPVRGRLNPCHRAVHAHWARAKPRWRSIHAGVD
ncbi:MAG: hypothetical protein KFB96_18280 [Thiocapsa sp.]|uniref:hypothetical protein n=1 Tax=Thiocapsa sp. TaxID=2024551 RepID=UPI001BCD6438|nr:hypothetical protein [Thiocapsa sp.]QVL47625.1 MAG: hypothetical protein KFB96_18280 [Thiocapsa sp.]